MESHKFGRPVREEIRQPAAIPCFSGSHVDHGWNSLTRTGKRESLTVKVDMKDVWKSGEMVSGMT